MITFWIGKKIYTAADKLRSGEDNRYWIIWWLILMFLALIAKLVWPVETREELWGTVILCLVAISVAERIGNAIFYDVLDRICWKFRNAAKSYDLCMLARVRIGDENKNDTVFGKEGTKAEVGIKYFLEQEQTKSLYNAVRIKNVKRCGGSFRLF